MKEKTMSRSSRSGRRRGILAIREIRAVRERDSGGEGIL